MILTNHYSQFIDKLTHYEGYKMDAYSFYINTYVMDKDNNEIEVLFGGYHGEAQWSFYKDTGYEFHIIEECDLIFQEAINTDEGSVVTITKEQLEKAEEQARDTYWERYSEGYYDDSF